MWPKLSMLALAASLIPVAALAQPAPSQDGGGPSSDVRAKIDAVRNDAKTAALADLSDAHRAQVQAIVDKFDADGSTLTLADAASQIDGVLTPQESAAMLADNQKMRDAMRAAFTSGGAGGPGGHGGRGGARGTPDAGRFLLQVDALPDKYRAAARAERAQH
jgi:hypothetical protein